MTSTGNTYIISTTTVQLTLRMSWSELQQVGWGGAQNILDHLLMMIQLGQDRLRVSRNA